MSTTKSHSANQECSSLNSRNVFTSSVKFIKTLKYVNCTEPPYLPCMISNRCTQLRHPPKSSECSNGVGFCQLNRNMVKSKKFRADKFEVYKSMIWDKFMVWSTILRIALHKVFNWSKDYLLGAVFWAIFLLSLLTLTSWQAGKAVQWRARLNSGNMTWSRCYVMDVHCYCTRSYISKFNTLRQSCH
jgi:hypothetical protein